MFSWLSHHLFGFLLQQFSFTKNKQKNKTEQNVSDEWTAIQSLNPFLWNSLHRHDNMNHCSTTQKGSTTFYAVDFNKHSQSRVPERYRCRFYPVKTRRCKPQTCIRKVALSVTLCRWADRKSPREPWEMKKKYWFGTLFENQMSNKTQKNAV